MLLTIRRQEKEKAANDKYWHLWLLLLITWFIRRIMPTVLMLRVSQSVILKYHFYIDKLIWFSRGIYLIIKKSFSFYWKIWQFQYKIIQNTWNFQWKKRVILTTQLYFNIFNINILIFLRRNIEKVWWIKRMNL
jgi:hypothetical protein